MKYFGEYLVKKGVITSQDLVEAFLDQIMHLPPLPKLIYDLKLLGSDQIMQAFITQQDENIDFASACRQLGYWNEEFNEKIEKIYDEQRVPFGQFLIQNGALDIKVLIKTLDEFLSQAENPMSRVGKAVPTSKPKAEPLPTQVSTTDTCVAPIVSGKIENLPNGQNNLNFKVPALDSTSREICDFFNTGKKDELDNLLTLVKQNVSVKELAGDFLQDVLKNIHTLKGVARFCKAEIIDFIADQIENALTSYLKSPFFGTKEVGEQLCLLISRALSILLDLRNSISDQKTEANFWNQVDNRIKLDAWTSEILKLNNLLKGVKNEAQSAMR
jgi:hypothetical protein